LFLWSLQPLGELLGTGSFGVVNHATRKSDSKTFAIKTIKKVQLSAEDLNSIQDEVDILRRVQHPGCVALVEVFESPKTIYIVMELLTGGELFERIIEKGSFSEKEASKVIREAVEAIQYLHKAGIVHRDLKPENLLYSTPETDSAIKITDFGLAKRKNPNQTLHTACGTPSYVAPEVLKRQPYSPAVDLWSIGVILYILLCGFPPFHNENTAELYNLIKAGDYSFPDPYWSDISPEAKDLVRGLLTVDPTKRYTSEKVLQHPWISGDVARSKDLGQSHLNRLKVLQAKRKLRRAVQVLIAANRFTTILKAAAKQEEVRKATGLTPRAGPSQNPFAPPQHDLAKDVKIEPPATISE
jgi:calcium/calmodulin-dependent protein kinase I